MHLPARTAAKSLPVSRGTVVCRAAAGRPAARTHVCGSADRDSSGSSVGHPAPCQPRDASTEQLSHWSTSRRSSLAVLSLLAWPVLVQEATAEEAAAAAPSSSTSSTDSGSSSSSAGPSSISFEPFLDKEYSIDIPSTFKYIEEVMNFKERGPQPEASPVLARFDAAAGGGSISVVVRPARAIKPTLFQVSDVAQYGDQLEVAKLLLPRGARLLGTGAVIEEQASRDTPVGTLPIPPKTYYTYEFKTPNGLNVAMATAAQAGKVYVVGAAVPSQEWDSSRDTLMRVVKSFRLRNSTSIFK